ncbi:hypothetical protein HH213_01930 [Duganella dendranthematis]|jgi:hypothetical protein|uniref:Uncharacterized protein n=1 Tax=Duganella dendranthematis TaxID=2728021 RepID=A0ABX6M3U6_9BURK|nr:hypothetical protein [Duganella dendranthematis]QJD88979.1 hypothetical protein HH213_01930 [Duganella dendranthematis]
MAIVIEFAFYLLMEVILYTIGRVVIPIISFGRARAIYAKEFFRGKLATYDEETGKMLISTWGASLIGGLTLWGVLLLSFTLAR